ncbi:GOLGA1 family protein [Megaselia abdita]
MFEMFSSLKNKIKEEKGAEVRFNNRGRLSSTVSISSIDEANLSEISSLRSQVRDLQIKLQSLNVQYEESNVEKNRLEKANEILLESVKVSQNQKELYCQEQEHIQNIQTDEIEKLKKLLSFREQEALDRLVSLQNNQQQIENLTSELERLKPLETMVEELQDELNRVKHSTQYDKNNMMSSLAALEEENKHLRSRIKIFEQSRLDVVATLNSDEKIKALGQERKLLEQHLEEAHLQLSDIKSVWSSQNLALETQLARLSSQVAEETTEKRRAVKERDESQQKVKNLEFDFVKLTEEVGQKDCKLKLQQEEIDELNYALQKCKEDREEEIICLKNQSESQTKEIQELRDRLIKSEERLTEIAENSEKISTALRTQNSSLNEKYHDMTNQFEIEREEKITALLRNAEISQSEEILKKELRIERDEITELQEENNKMKVEITDLKNKVNDLEFSARKREDHSVENDVLKKELCEKNQVVRNLTQRLSDVKKEFQSNGKLATVPVQNLVPKKPSSDSGIVVMDDVNFSYLKHVIIKFLTSREVILGRIKELKVLPNKCPFRWRRGNLLKL